MPFGTPLNFSSLNSWRATLTGRIRRRNTEIRSSHCNRRYLIDGFSFTKRLNFAEVFRPWNVRRHVCSLLEIPGTFNEHSSLFWQQSRVRAIWGETDRTKNHRSLTKLMWLTPLNYFSTVQQESVFHVQQVDGVMGSFRYPRSLLLLRFMTERPLAAALNRLFSAASHSPLCGFSARFAKCHTQQ